MAAVGFLESGDVSVGNSVTVQTKTGAIFQTVATGIERFRKVCDTAAKGDNVGILLRGVDKSQV